MKKFKKILLIGVTLMFVGCTNTVPKVEENKESKEESTEVKEENTMKEITELIQFNEVKDEPIATIKTNMGDVTLKLFPKYAPKTVENFITHAKNGYYDGVIFHRVIEDFMIQTGDPTGTGRGGESIYGAKFEDEVTPELRHFYGAVSMANAGPNTNGSQFFIVTNDGLPEEFATEFEKNKENQEEIIFESEDGQHILLKHVLPTIVIDKYLEIGGAYNLDFKHTVFGHVIDGMDVAMEIEKVETNNEKPVEDVIIETIVIN